MPNWSKGNIRLRGRREAIDNFLKNEITFVGTVPGGLDIKEYSPDFSEDEWGSRRFTFPKNSESLIFRSFYIKGTRRNFIDSSIEYYWNDEDNPDAVAIVCIDGFSAAWGTDPQPYVEKSKKYGIDIKIIAYEKGMMFREEIEIVDGELIKNEETSYDDTNEWYWDAEWPNLGG